MIDSSTTSWPTSTSSSTSDRARRARPGTAARISGLIRLVHPFPSLLTSSASAGIAALAGGDPGTVARIFLAMLGIQLSIGSLNDLVDAPADAVSKPHKPIAAGVVGPRVATVMAGGGAAVGLGLSAVSGPMTLLVGACCLGLGWAYDLRLSRTAFSWLPLSLALPLLPIHAWVGAAGSVPAALLTLVPIGVLAGAGLAIANGLVDVDRDRATRRSAVVVRLGRSRAWWLQTVVLGAAAILALALYPGAARGVVAPSSAGSLLANLAWPLLVLGCAFLALGAAVLASSRPGVRERGWELDAVGIAFLGIGWLAGVVTVGGG